MRRRGNLALVGAERTVTHRVNGKRTRIAMPVVESWRNSKPQDTKIGILIGTPTLGTLRIEWHNSMQAMAAPPNWGVARSSPVGYPVPDAQNMLVDSCLRGGHRALLFIEDDTCPPADALLVFDRWFWKMERKKAPPVVSGLYHIKNSSEQRRGKTGGIEQLGPEPLAYRGPSQRAYRDWTPGDVIWLWGVPTGALLIHRSVLEAWVREPDIDLYSIPGYPHAIKRVFQQPSSVWVEPGGVHAAVGTSDLWWSEQTIKRGIFAKAGWPQYQKKKYPFLMDTALEFKHVDRLTGELF